MSSSSFRKSTLREYFESIIIAVILALFIRTWMVQAFKIPTGSMEQNLLVGDHLLVNKFVFGPAETGLEQVLLPFSEVKRGDVLVFKYPEDPTRDFIKRVVGLPSETLEVRDERVYINGAPLDEPYLESPLSSRVNEIVVDRADNFGPVTIPSEHYFMMGDNRDNSEDSRYWGVLPHSHVKGRAMMIYWSFGGTVELIRETGLAATVQRIVSVGTNFFTGTRWDRTFKQVR